MTLIITILHILVSLSLIFVVLLQKGSGADMGAAFGGSSQNVFGARGSGSFLGKLTAGLATVFMLTSLSLAFFTTQRNTDVSVMERLPAVDKGKAKEVETDPTPVPAKGAELPAAPAKPAELDKPAKSADQVKPEIPAASGEPVKSEVATPVAPVPEKGPEKGPEEAIPAVPKASP